MKFRVQDVLPGLDFCSSLGCGPCMFFPRRMSVDSFPSDFPITLTADDVAHVLLGVQLLPYP